VLLRVQSREILIPLSFQIKEEDKTFREKKEIKAKVLNCPQICTKISKSLSNRDQD